MADNEAKIETIRKILDTNVGNSDAFPKTVVQNIWDTAKKGSIIQTLAGAVPLSLNGDAIPIPVGQATAGVVAEGETKPVTTMATKVKTVTPIKVATMILYSMETAQADPLGEYSRIQGFLAEAIARSVDMAVIHGVDANTGTKITGKEALRDTTKAIEIDLAQEKAGYIGKRLTAGYDAVVLDVVDEHEFDFNHFLFAPKFRSSLVNALDGQGRPLYQASTNLADYGPRPARRLAPLRLRLREGQDRCREAPRLRRRLQGQHPPGLRQPDHLPSRQRAGRRHRPVRPQPRRDPRGGPVRLGRPRHQGVREVQLQVIDSPQGSNRRTGGQ